MSPSSESWIWNEFNADECGWVPKYLKKDQNFRVKIFTDWACCKVENKMEDEESICETIKVKLEQ